MFHMGFLLLLMLLVATVVPGGTVRLILFIYFLKKYRLPPVSKSLAPVTQSSSTSCCFDATRSQVPVCAPFSIYSRKKNVQVRTSCDSHYIHTGTEDPKGRDSGQTRAEFMRSGGPAPVPLRGRKEPIKK